MRAQDIDVDALIGRQRSHKLWFILAGALGVVGVAVSAFMLVQSGETDIVVEPQPVEASTGQLTTTVDLSGSAAAAQTSSLTFGLAGEVGAIDVEAGAEVSAGQVLARFDTTQLELAVREAELNLELQLTELAELPSNGRTAAEAAADQAAARLTAANADIRIADAQARVDGLNAGPTEAEIAANARDLAAQKIALLEAQDALADLEAGPTAEQIATAELAIARAEVDLLQSAEALAEASGQLGLGVSLASILSGDSSAPAEVVLVSMFRFVS